MSEQKKHRLIERWLGVYELGERIVWRCDNPNLYIWNKGDICLIRYDHWADFFQSLGGLEEEIEEREMFHSSHNGKIL